KEPSVSLIRVQRGNAPLLLSVPHAGTAIPDAISAQFVSAELALKDTDWHVDALYAFAAELGATLVSTQASRSVVDVNRDPSGQSLYPGLPTTELVPLETFDGEPLYEPDRFPDEEEVERRIAMAFAPYHEALRAEIERLRSLHGCLVVYDCHS